MFRFHWLAALAFCTLLAGSAFARPNCDDPETAPPICDKWPSPIIIDVDGHGFHLTSADNGVWFDITGTGQLEKLGWTAAGSTNAFLALPQNGIVTNGRELFGNFTPQAHSKHPNGFLALAEYDKPENGGNEDGVIDASDAIFSSLRLWVDANHDGICQPEELHTLPELGVFSISVRYTRSQRVDDFGNRFRYKARINVTDEEEDKSKAAPVAYDVFFTTVED